MSNEEYLRRNLLVAKAEGAKAGASRTIKRLEQQTRPPKWLLASLYGIMERAEALAPDLARWRDIAGVPEPANQTKGKA